MTVIAHRTMTTVCPSCNGEGCDNCHGAGRVAGKRCSACNELKPLECFYGRKRKQPRCIPCYNMSYGAYYRRSLREARR